MCVVQFTAAITDSNITFSGKFQLKLKLTRRSQDFGCTFLSWPSKHRLKPPKSTPYLPNFLKKLHSCSALGVHSLPEGALTTFPCKFGPQKIFLRLGAGGARATVHPLATPMVWNSPEKVILLDFYWLVRDRRLIGYHNVLTVNIIVKT